MQTVPEAGVNADVCMVASWQRIFRDGFVASWPKFAYMSWYGTRSSTVRPSADHVQRVLPARPRLVVISTTPFAAFVPYSVAADGPFTISMSSISSGFSELRREKPTSVPELSELSVPKPAAE
jgi:hypothetical protein